VIVLLRKLAFLAVVAALGLSLTGTAGAKNKNPSGNALGNGLNFADGR
jgi:hypothetical protein